MPEDLFIGLEEVEEEEATTSDTSMLFDGLEEADTEPSPFAGIDAPGSIFLPGESPNNAGDAMLHHLAYGVQPEEVSFKRNELKTYVESDPVAGLVMKAVTERMNRRLEQARQEQIEAIRDKQIQRITNVALMQAPEQNIWQKTSSWFKSIFTDPSVETADAIIAFEAHQKGKTKEAYMREIYPEGEFFRRSERFKDNVFAGGAGVIEGMAGGMEWLTGLDFYSQFAAEAAVWRSELSSEEQDFADVLASGLGSQAIFFAPGFGVAGGARLLTNIAPRVARWMGATTMAATESMTEAGIVYREALRKTGSHDAANSAANFTFALNMPLLLVTNKMGIFAEDGSFLNRFIMGGTFEGGQEVGQEKISSYALGESPTTKDLVTAFGAGFLLGGGMGSIQGLAETMMPEDTRPVANEGTLIDKAFKALELLEVKGQTQEQKAALAKKLDTTEAEIEQAATNLRDNVIPQNELEKEVLGHVVTEGVVAEGVTEITEERINEILESEATEDEIADTLIAELEGVPVTEEVAEEVVDTLEDIPEEAEIITTLEQVEDEAADAPLEQIGRIAYAEGATDIQSFTQSMQAKLGELWERFKGKIKQIFDAVVEFNRRLGRRGEIELGAPLFEGAPQLKLDEQGKPVFNLDERFNTLVDEVIEEERRKFIPIKPLEGYTLNEIRATVNNIRNDKPLTNARQKEVLLGFVEEISNRFYAEVESTKGEFIDATEFLEQDELNDIINKEIKTFVDSIKFQQIKPPTKAELLEKEVKAQSAEIEKLKEQVRERVQETFKQQDVIEAERAKAVTLSEEFKKELRDTVKALKQAAREGKTEAVKAERARLKELIKTRKSKSELRARARSLRSQIKRALKFTKVKKQGGKPKGRFTPEIQKMLDLLRESAKLKQEEAGDKIAANLEKYSTTIPPFEVALENRILSMVNDFGNRSVPELERLLADIKALKNEGKAIAELKKLDRREIIDKAKADIMDVITNKQGLPENINTVGKAASVEKFANQLTLTEKAKKWFSTTGTSITSWDEIMDILSRLDPSKPGESKLSLFADVLKEENAELQGTTIWTQKVKSAYIKAYNIKGEGRALDREFIKRLQEDMKQENLGTFTDLNGVSDDLIFTRAEARKRWAEMQDPTLEETITKGMAWSEDMKRAIGEFLTPQDKAFVKATSELYQKYYPTINNIYREIYGVDLPRNEFYTPIRREGVKVDEMTGFGEFMQQINMNASVAGKSMISRVKNIRPLKKQSDMAVLEQHISEMEHFKAWAEKARELTAIFGDAEIRTAIEMYHDKNIIGVIDNFMADYIRGGVERSNNLNWLDKLRSNVARSVLAIKPAIGVKQLTSFIAYADTIPVTDFVAGVSDFMSDPVGNFKILRENSVMLKERGKNMERDIKTALKTDEFQTWRENPNFWNTLMLNIQIGDQGAIALGGWSVYKHALNQGKSQKEAIRIFEKVTKSTQQSANLSELSVWQRGNSFAKLFTMFLSSPNQYYRKEVGAIRNVLAGRISKTQAAKTIIIYHALLPMFFQFVSDGFTWDEDEQKRAMTLGALNGIFIMGDMLNLVIREAYGLRKFDVEVPVISIADDVVKAMKLLDLDDLDSEQTLRAIRGLAGAVGSITGTPVKQAIDIGAGANQILTGDYERGLAQFLGWSPYVAEKIAED